MDEESDVRDSSGSSGFRTSVAAGMDRGGLPMGIHRKPRFFLSISDGRRGNGLAMVISCICSDSGRNFDYVCMEKMSKQEMEVGQ